MASQMIRAADLAAPKPGTGWWFTAINLTGFDRDAREQIVQQIAFGHPIRPNPSAPRSLLGSLPATILRWGLAVAIGIMWVLLISQPTTAGAGGWFVALLFASVLWIGHQRDHEAKAADTPAARVTAQITCEVDLHDHLHNKGNTDTLAYSIHRELAMLTDWQRLHNQGTITDDEWDSLLAQAFKLRATTAVALTLPADQERNTGLLRERVKYTHLSLLISTAVRHRGATPPSRRPTEPEGIPATTSDQAVGEAPTWWPLLDTETPQQQELR